MPTLPLRARRSGTTFARSPVSAHRPVRTIAGPRPDRARVRRGLGRAVVVLGVGLLCGGAQCRRAGPTPPHPGAAGALDLRPSDPQQRADWDRLQEARAADPAGAEVRAIAEHVLAGQPSLTMRLAALRAKAEHAYLNREDEVAIATAEQGLGLVPEPSEESQVLVDLARIRLRALVRGGDPAAALAALSDPRVQARGGLEPAEAAGLAAVALDRNADGPAAVAALVRWRELLADEDPTAAWVEQRVALRADALAPAALTEVISGLPPGPGRACLQARRGEPVADPQPDWVAACTASSGSIGLLLPRSGPFSAFSDEQLAAAMATVDVVASEGPVPRLLWRDSGSSPKSARAAARSLMDQGARVLVGPVGAKNVKAVASEVQGRAALIVPGEGRRGATGVAPRLEQRVAALVDHARAQGRDRLVVLAPDNGYGRRAVKAIESQAAGFAKPLVTRLYPPQTTSFGPHVNPVMTALRGDAALLVPDTLIRTELVVRQVARSGRMPARPDVPGVMVLATAEGVSPQTLDRARDVLEGVWMAPAAPRGPAGEAFEAAYTRMQGERPGDQGLLVYHALSQAITGQPGPGAATTTLCRVTEGRLVVQAATAAEPE